MKKLSVITINYNNRDGLLRTIKSVAGQTCRDFEYIVIDGGSTDGSVDVIKEYADYIDYWVSEPDKGIYNAMNKGVRAAHGEFCQFLNSGDWYYNNNVVSDVMPLLKSDYDVICGSVCVVEPNGDKYISKQNPRYVNAIYLINNTISHQSSFIKTELLIRNLYDETLKIVSDWKFFLEAYCLYNCKFQHIDNVVAYYDNSGISSVNAEKSRAERDLVLSKLMPERIGQDIISCPMEYVYLLSNLPKNAFRFNQLLFKIMKCCIKLYSWLK